MAAAIAEHRLPAEDDDDVDDLEETQIPVAGFRRRTESMIPGASRSSAANQLAADVGPPTSGMPAPTRATPGMPTPMMPSSPMPSPAVPSPAMPSPSSALSLGPTASPRSDAYDDEPRTMTDAVVPGTFAARVQDVRRRWQRLDPRVRIGSIAAATVVGVGSLMAMILGGGDEKRPAPTEELAVVATEPKPVAPAATDTAPASVGSTDPAAAEGQALPANAATNRAIAKAIREHTIRSLDALLIDSPRAKSTDFDGAVGYCETRKVAGIEGWRVPTLGELRSLYAAGMFKPGSYWSQTEADANGREHFVFVTSGKKLVPHDNGWASGRVLCIRDR